MGQVPNETLVLNFCRLKNFCYSFAGPGEGGREGKVCYYWNRSEYSEI